ncbi:unnamed protein product [Rangifer tarandus platyrhynchus]|uniref:Uncharacterized protein n=2 Tax=Rangifer tarandus platyrhynchus TaxID=3082113 RepID=A0ABN8YSS3_RANTA|nr:unnamed protein product [Rangifer tarandus platyrhynchus]CAI9702171.1 unnamed protein product [Rangifer tarandus platyrhynchus]
MGRERGTLAHTQPAAAAREPLGPAAGQRPPPPPGLLSPLLGVPPREGAEQGGAGAAAGAGAAGGRRARAGLPDLGARFRLLERSGRGSRSRCQRSPPARPPAGRSRASFPGGRSAAALPPPSFPRPPRRTARVPFFPGPELREPASPRASQRRGPPLAATAAASRSALGRENGAAGRAGATAPGAPLPPGGEGSTAAPSARSSLGGAPRTPRQRRHCGGRAERAPGRFFSFPSPVPGPDRPAPLCERRPVPSSVRRPSRAGLIRIRRLRPPGCL